MTTRRAYTPPTVAVAAILLLLVPLLAYLQYVWLGQLSEREYERMRNSLRSSAFGLSMELNHEITDLLKSSGEEVRGPETAALTEVRQRLVRWKALSLHPALVDTSQLSSPPSAALVIPLRVDERSSISFYRDASGFVVPIGNDPGRCVLVRLNVEYLRSSLLPELIKSHLSADGETTHNVVVINKTRDIFFSNAAAMTADILTRSDVVVPLLYFPPSPLNTIPPSPRAHATPDSAGAGLQPSPPGREPSTGTQRPERGSPEAGLFGPGRGLEELTVFQMYIRHQGGSLEEIVNRNRVRNLIIGFSVLVLLGASVVFLLVISTRAQRLARQQLDFVAGISHELRTPLAVLKSAGENLADGVVSQPGRAQQYGQVIVSEVSRLSDVVEKALAYASIHSGRRLYELQPVDIAGILEEVLYSVKRKTVRDRLTIETSLAPDLPMILGDAPALRSALENLITNAIKYGGEEPWVRIEGRRSPNGPFVEIIVQDRGIGIPAAELEDIFEPFQRGQNAVDLQIPGSGLGLSIARHIVEGHRGKISVQSTKDAGTVFTVSLPAGSSNGEVP